MLALNRVARAQRSMNTYHFKRKYDLLFSTRTHCYTTTKPGYYFRENSIKSDIHLLSANKIGIYIVGTMMSDYSPLHLYFLNKSLWAGCAGGDICMALSERNNEAS